ncbi:GPI-anchored cell wall beta-1,3-endoglucanase EglC [Xylaria cf. heliscus]|nr:GPI-anchored cell wall beta-1,3-endoglucanase EglC [Xylaria cf. heliscus]
MQIQFIAITLGVFAASSSGAYQGFNYGSLKNDGSCQGYDGFKELFERAKNLPGTSTSNFTSNLTSSFTAARLYTSIQCGTSVDPIEAYRAAIDTDTKIFVGLWASAGRYVFENELNALRTAATTLGTAFTDRVVAISVGSEDLYRSSPEGGANNAGQGATASEIMGYIGWARDWLKYTPLASKPITHVDTWTAWILPESEAVINSVDFLSHTAFPYFEGTRPNSIEHASDNFWSGMAATEQVAQGKEIWITETGWPVTGPTLRDAVPSVQNAKTYWDTIGCSLFGNVTTFWYTLVDAAATEWDLSFGITPTSDNTPKFDLTCP